MAYSHILKERYGIYEVEVGEGVQVLQYLTMKSYITDCFNEEPVSTLLDLVYEEAGALPLMCLIGDAINDWCDVEELDFAKFIVPWLKANLQDYLEACIFAEVCNYSQEQRKYNVKMDKVKVTEWYRLYLIDDHKTEFMLYTEQQNTKH
jgi:hypothetical protein